MTKRSWFFVTLGLGAGALLVAAACAPAAEPKPAAPAAQQPAAAPQQPKAAEKPVVQAPVAPLERPKAQEAAAGVATSVSGIPLDPGARKGGVLRTAAIQEGPSFNPWEEAAGIAFMSQQPVTNMIVQPRSWGTAQDFEKGAYLEIHPDLARSWEQSADGLTWTFKFRDGVKWSDGVPFTCRDAKWTLDAIRTGKGLLRSPRAVHFLPVKEITCPDDLTMVLKLSRPKPSLLEMIGMAYNMVFPAHIYENDTKALREKPTKAGTGPFVLKEWVPGEKYVFVKKEDYWNKPYPYLDGIETPLLGRQAQVAALRAGRVDLAGTGFTWSAAQAETLLKECKDCQTFTRQVSYSASYVYVNHQRPPWNTPEVKDALSYAIDRKKYVQVDAQGWGTPPLGGVFFPDTYWAMPSDLVKTIPGYNFDDPEGNKQKAREILAKAGYKPGELVFKLYWWQSGGRTAPVVLEEELRAVGFGVTLVELETARAYNQLTAAEFDVQTHGHFLGNADPDVMLYEHYYTGSDRNYGRYSNPQVDRLIDLQSVTIDPEQRRRIAWQAGETIMREHGKIILSHGNFVPMFGPRVRGIMPGNAAIVTYGPWHRHEHTWLAEK